MFRKLLSLDLRLRNVIKSYKSLFEKKIASAKDEIIQAKDYKKENPVDWTMTNIMGEPSDGSARITNAELNVKLAEETIIFGEELENTFIVLEREDYDHVDALRVVSQLHDALNQHLTKLELEYKKIPESSWNQRESDLNDIKKFWIRAKIIMVTSLLTWFKKDDPEFGTELQEFNGGRRRKRTGKKRSRSGTTRMRRGSTRRRLHRR
jgi:hypothetical protein